MLVSIESKDLPGFPGLVAYQITGQSAEVVQREITRLFNQVEQSGGWAEFRNPVRSDNYYLSRGYTFVAKTE